MKLGIKMITDQFDSLQDTVHLQCFISSEPNFRPVYQGHYSNFNFMINVYHQSDTTLFLKEILSLIFE